MLKRPVPLKEGDKVAITAPSSPVPEDILARSVESIKFLGLEPVVMPSCAMHHGYLAGKDAQRADDINKAFANEDIKGIFCLRGGFGATRILPMLDLKMIKKNLKVFVGYSDITALHITLNQLCGFVTFHGPMPNTGYDRLDSYSLASLKANLFDSKPAGKVINPRHQQLEVINAGEASGTIIGGNLSLLQGTLGSPYEINAKDKILFIEEVGERLYRLDKALTALSLAGKFSDCAGIILGTFAECGEPAQDELTNNANIAEGFLSLKEIFREVIKPYKKPTILNFRAGHIYPQSTIAMGTDVYFNTDEQAVLFRD